MRRGKSKPQSSRERPGAVGLLFFLATAILLGVCVGSYLGGRFASQPAPPSGSRPSPRSAVGGRVTTSPQAQRRDAPKPVTLPRRQPESAEPRPAAESGTTETRQEAPAARVREEPRPGRPEVRRRPRAMPGEIAHAAASDKIALTLDAGASSVPTAAILSALRGAGLHVTFFLTGKWAEQNPELVRQIRQDGHEIGNHTYSHPDLRKLSDEEIREQLQKTDDIVARITGRPCDPYFRSPYGGRDKRVIRVAAEAGYAAIYWSLDSWDAFKKGITGSEIKQRVLERIQGGDIVLMHCGSQATADALPGIIEELQNRGYRIVTVSELIGR